MMAAKIGIVGTGYVGLVAATAFASVGNLVHCVDLDSDKIQKLTDGIIPFYEPGLDQLFEGCRQNLTFSCEIKDILAESDIVFLAVGTPELESGAADKRLIVNVIDEICLLATKSLVVVLKSTVPIGTAYDVQRYCDSKSKHRIRIVSNPEFLRQGSAVKDFMRPDRIVVGSDSGGECQLVNELYKPFMSGSTKLLYMDTKSAEMTKYVANSFLAMKVSFINDMNTLANKLGANIKMVKQGFTSDHRIDPAFFNPGLGYGGSCFPKDIRALIRLGERYGVDLDLLKATEAINEKQKGAVVTQVCQRFDGQPDRKIAIWGLSFKPETDDLRNAPSLKIIEGLVAAGHTVKAYDPVAGESAKKVLDVKCGIAKSPIDAVVGADALVVVTEWGEFLNLDFCAVQKQMALPIVFDGRNHLRSKNLRKLGFEYYPLSIV